MSAGEFRFARYYSDTLDEVMPIRVQPETLALTLGSVPNESFDSAISLNLRVNVSGNKNELGVKPRTVTLKWDTPADAPDDYSPAGRLVVPIMSEALWLNVQEGNTLGSYLGGAVVVVGKSPELKR